MAPDGRGALFPVRDVVPGNREFNPPSLRGLSHRGPFFHDNSAAALEDVFAKQGHPSAATYSADELKDLLAFLLSL